jgi:hypothetical protein
VLPVGELLAFAAGSEAFVSRGMIERLHPVERSAVIEHEREHARRRHGRLVAVARALAYGFFGLPPAARASRVLQRELDVLADRAAATRLEDPATVTSALRRVAGQTAATPLEDAAMRRRLEQLAAPAQPHSGRAEHTVRLVALGVGVGVVVAVCLSIHTSTPWLGVAACALLIASVIVFTAPVLAPDARPRQRASATPPARERITS